MEGFLYVNKKRERVRLGAAKGHPSELDYAVKMLA